MENIKKITVILDDKSYSFEVNKNMTIGDIKKTISNYEITQFRLNPSEEIMIVGTNIYDNITLGTVFHKLNKTVIKAVSKNKNKIADFRIAQQFKDQSYLQDGCENIRRCRSYSPIDDCENISCRSRGKGASRKNCQWGMAGGNSSGEGCDSE